MLVRRGVAERVRDHRDAVAVLERGRQRVVRPRGADAAAGRVVLVAVPGAVAVVPAHDPALVVGPEPQRHAGGVDHRREPAALVVAVADQLAPPLAVVQQEGDDPAGLALHGDPVAARVLQRDRQAGGVARDREPGADRVGDGGEQPVRPEVQRPPVRPGHRPAVARRRERQPRALDRQHRPARRRRVEQDRPVLVGEQHAGPGRLDPRVQRRGPGRPQRKPGAVRRDVRAPQRQRQHAGQVDVGLREHHLAADDVHRVGGADPALERDRGVPRLVGEAERAPAAGHHVVEPARPAGDEVAGGVEAAGGAGDAADEAADAAPRHERQRGVDADRRPRPLAGGELDRDVDGERDAAGGQREGGEELQARHEGQHAEDRGDALEHRGDRLQDVGVVGDPALDRVPGPGQPAGLLVRRVGLVPDRPGRGLRGRFVVAVQRPGLADHLVQVAAKALGLRAGGVVRRAQVRQLGRALRRGAPREPVDLGDRGLLLPLQLRRAGLQLGRAALPGRQTLPVLRQGPRGRLVRPRGEVQVAGEVGELAAERVRRLAGPAGRVQPVDVGRRVAEHPAGTVDGARRGVHRRRIPGRRVEAQRRELARRHPCASPSEPSPRQHVEVPSTVRSARSWTSGPRRYSINDL